MRTRTYQETGPTQDELNELAEWRSKRFRILVCIDGSDECYEGLRFAADIGRSDECDIIMCYVRPIDHGLRTGGLQVRVARENMLDWGLDLPGIGYLKKGLEILLEEGDTHDEWNATTTTRAVGVIRSGIPRRNTATKTARASYLS